jgi:hypothetical protein
METLITTSPSSPLILSFVSSTGTALISSSSPIAKKKKKNRGGEEKTYLVSDYNLCFDFVALVPVQ